MKLPGFTDRLEHPMYFLRDNSYNITFQDVIDQKEINPALLIVLVTLCRTVVMNARPFPPKPRDPAKQTERDMRLEVYSYGREMNFHPDTLESLHPVHVGEILKVMLLKLKIMGIDADAKKPQGSDLIQ